MGGKTKENGTCRKSDEDSDLTEIIGGNGPWQRLIFILFLLAAVPSAWHNMVMSFLAPNIKHWCAKPSTYQNMTKTEWINALEKISTVKKQFGQCYIHQHENRSDIKENIYLLPENSTTLSNITMSVLIEEIGNSTQPCQEWHYDNTEYTNTVVSQWNLVCDREWMISMTKSIFMIGFLLSLLVMGQLADRFGRKPVLMASLCIFMASAIISAFSISFIMFAVSRFFVAFGIAGLFNTAFVHLMEIISPESRSFYGLAVEFGWALGYVVLPAMGWLIRDWNLLQIAITGPCVILFIMWWFVPESPRWLLTQGKLDDAIKILRKAAEANGKDAQEVESSLKRIWSKSEYNTTNQKKVCNIFDLFRTPGLWQRTLNMCFAWFVASFIYYGLSYNTNDLAGDPFINFAIAGAVEFPAYAISIFVIKTMGRRRPLMITFVIGGIACLATLPLTGNLEWIRMPLAMFGKFCITAAFGIVYVYTAEIFPTVIRNTGLGCCSICARFGSIIAPFVKELGQYTHTTVPLICFGILSIVSGILIMLLPETNGIKVPDTLEDAADFGRKKKKKKDTKEESEDMHKPCIIHVENNGTVEKSKEKLTLSSKPVSDGKKLPDLLEEPSIIDEVIDDEQLTSDVYDSPESTETTSLKPSNSTEESVFNSVIEGVFNSAYSDTETPKSSEDLKEDVELKEPTQNESNDKQNETNLALGLAGDNSQQTPL